MNTATRRSRRHETGEHCRSGGAGRDRIIDLVGVGMSDITEIETEARAYVEDCWDRCEPEVGEYRYLVAMLAVIDGLRSEARHYVAADDAKPEWTEADVNDISEFDRKTEINKRVQARYDEFMAEGKHGHYETMFRVVHEEIKRAQGDPT